MYRTNRKISTLIESQLPSFIASEYEYFSKFLEKYYQHLESTGNVLDIINNIITYSDIDFYDSSVFTKYTTVSSNFSSSADSITVEDATSFPEENGYIKIDDEICFYQNRTTTQFLNVSRGISGTTKLGDLYESSTFITTNSSSHFSGAKVYNLSNLFLYAIAKHFESQYLQNFPEKYLNETVNKKSLIKNIKQFYQSKGTESSIKFIFNSIIAKTPDNIPEVFYPKDSTLKLSTSDWNSTNSIRVKIVSGDPFDLIGQNITQNVNGIISSAVVDNVLQRNISGNSFYELVLAPDSIVGEFKIASKTKLRKQLSNIETNRINVISTYGWNENGSLLIGNEIIDYSVKNITQLSIVTRLNPALQPVDSDVYSLSEQIVFNDVKFIVFGVFYNSNNINNVLYSSKNDAIQFNTSGITSKDPIIYNKKTNTNRWIFNNTSPNVPSNPTIQQIVSNFTVDTSAIFENFEYYYICSSGIPSHSILTSAVSIAPSEQKILRLIKKTPVTTTEIYKTPSRDVGIFVNGVLAYGCKDDQYISYGKIISSKIIASGSGYTQPPYVLINGEPNKAISTIAGGVVEKIEITSDEIFSFIPTVEIVSGRGAKAKAIITKDKITSIKVINAGEYYSAPPKVLILDSTGKGKFAEYKAVLNNYGQVVNFVQVNEGKFYSKGNVTVELIEDARNTEAKAEVDIKKWHKNRYFINSTKLDSSNGYLFQDFNSVNLPNKTYGYGYVANPKQLRYSLSDNIESNLSSETSIKTHSPILGYAYDGNPIYGPYGYSNPLNNSSQIVRLSSGYSQNNSRTSGPSITEYPLGSFTDDYTWISSVNSGKTVLDRNNGRFCVTPEYPSGVYAYFITITNTNIPVFPYILGENYYSLPTELNYTTNISQENLPKDIKRVKNISNINGIGSKAVVDEIFSGSVDKVDIQYSTECFNVGNSLIIDNSDTGGEGAQAIVSSIKGKQVSSIESVQTKAFLLNTKKPVYFYDGDIITQDSTNANGTIVGNVFDTNTVVLRNVEGLFNSSDLISSSTNVIKIITKDNCTFSSGETLYLTNNDGSTIATGIILNSITFQNTIKVKVLTGQFSVVTTHYLKSSKLNDSTGIFISSIESISQDIELLNVNENIAVVSTTEPHNLSVGDLVDIDINPDTQTTQTTYYVRKKYYQEIKLTPPSINCQIDNTGISRYQYLNGGFDYETGQYLDVELIFNDTTKIRSNVGNIGNVNNARANITVNNINGSGRGIAKIDSISVQGFGYKKGDILTVTDESLNRFPGSISTQRLLFVVDHVGFSKEETLLKVNNVNNISIDDDIIIDEEILTVTNVDSPSKTLTVIRGTNNTVIKDHYNASFVNLYNPKYRFTQNSRPIGVSQNNPYISKFDNNNLICFYDYNVSNPNSITLSSTFNDASTPAKKVTISSVESPYYQFEFSKNNTLNFINDPVIEITNNYQYKFDTSHSSLVNTYFDISPGINNNIISVEMLSNSIEPGSSGSFSILKTGFVTKSYLNNNLQYVKSDIVKYSKYYYYDKNNNIKSNGYLNLILDPLQGQKTIIYKSNDKFVYSLSKLPIFDGSGVISYTTTSNSAIGNINDVFITNYGNNYAKIPIVKGVEIASNYEANAEVVYDSIEKNINSVLILNQGSNYVKPIVFVEGDGFGAKFEVITSYGKITKIKVIDKGKNYTKKPVLKIIESNVKIFLDSSNIGIPKNINIIDNGYEYTNDYSTINDLKLPTILFLYNFEYDSFYLGEQIFQTDIINGQEVEICSGVVTDDGWRYGSNILKLKNIIGTFDENLPIKGRTNNKTANIKKIINNNFSPIVKSYYDNNGQYNSDKGILNSFSQNITDSYFYQDYSYVIKSKSQLKEWKDIILNSTHPAGFKVFGELSIENDSTIGMGNNVSPFKSITFINAAVKNVKVVETPRISITETVLNYDDINIEKGFGSISIDTFNNTETLSNELILSPKFDGKYDESTGNLVGTKTFTLLDKKSRLAFSPYNEQQLMISIDGIIQEPKKSFKISGNQITFAEPPLGERKEKFGANDNEYKIIPAQNFYCKSFKFKDNNLNSKYLKKIKNISFAFDGIQNEFDLYYENGSIVKTDPQEKLIVCLNGVLQKAKKYYNEPSKNSYYIERNSDSNITDKIIFSSAPISYGDIYENSNSRVNTFEKCFIYSIASYERFTIDKSLIPYKKSGPYLITNEITDKVTQIDNSQYPLVFVDGILQNNKKSYEIVGATITFSEPLNYYISESGEEIYSDVSIILPYGRDLEKSLTLYDFEPDTYYNTILITLQGSDIYNTVNALYNGLNDYDKVLVYQGNNLYGELKNISGSGDNVILTAINSKNLIRENFDNSSNIKLNINGSDSTITGTYSIIFDYKKDSDGNKILQYGAYTGRSLYGTAYKEEIEERRKLKRICKIYPGDMIKIDGEDEFRKILSISNNVQPKNNISGEYASSEIFTTALATNYNGIQKGEGLSVFANISNGTITNLTWNRKELELFFENDILLQPTAYQYYTNPILQFIPVDGNGGGGKAEVLVHDGQILDVILINGGKNYTDNPIVKVARNFSIKKQNPRKITCKIHTGSITTYSNQTLAIRIATTFTTEE
jgi:hypothetical protein